ncbi:MAG TPA: hypothetical protein VIA62_23890 [Thermoanaerobaculia bacterium]|nr:hypothetical protein [Thermoanaerobaculia bacterium]
MASVTIAVSLVSGALQYVSSDSTIVSVTGGGSGTRLRLWYAPDDPTIQLTFVPDTGIASLDSLITPAAAFGGSSIQSSGSGIVLTCNYLELYESWSFPTGLQVTPVGTTQALFHDPTIVFNPPSTLTSQCAEAPVAAEPVMV